MTAKQMLTQGFTASCAADGLCAMVTNTATVIRQEGEVSPSAAAAGTALAGGEIPMRELVAGDIVSLSAGDMIPADRRVLSACDLFVSQAAMTGQSLPLEKSSLCEVSGPPLREAAHA